MGKNASLTVAVVVGASLLLTGYAAGRHGTRVEADRELLGLALADELEVTGLCTIALNQRSDPQRLAQALERRLDAAMDSATLLLGEGAQLGPATPNLRDSARRAADHYAAAGNAVKRQQAEALLAKLNGAR